MFFSSASQKFFNPLLNNTFVVLSIAINLDVIPSRQFIYFRMGNSSAKHHYETAKKTGTLNLCDCSLTEFPTKLKELSPILRQLNLSNNKFHALPSHIGNFSNLKSLKVDNNRLVSLPDEITKLIKLENLSAMSNRINSVSNNLSALINLKEIHLSDNQISEFPKFLCELKHLTLVELSRNKITEIPSCIGKINASEINLNDNQISVVSPEIAKAPKLKMLKLENNCLSLSAVPKSLLKDSKVSSLLVVGNHFDIKDFEHLDGYENYMQRYTETKKKMF